MKKTSSSGPPARRKLLAYVIPMLLFVLLLGVGSSLKTPGAALWRTAPEFWIYPLQTLLGAGLLIYFRHDYEFGPFRRPAFAITIGLLVFILWIAPQQLLHFRERVVGFNPDTFAAEPALYWTTLAARFIRLVIVVPLIEEIFWRGFLLRYLISEKFESLPVGAFSWLSFAIVTLAFGFSHSSADWPAAFLTGALYNAVAYRTRSLSCCALAHGLTNLALGLWIVATKQWGFW
jgi:CAAX prenyl protease-like protein